ncbi:MAG: hypothetical protein QM793_12660 [Muricomes sp.]
MNEEQEKRMAQSYEITQAISIGDKEVVFGVDERKEMPYFCAFYASMETEVLKPDKGRKV